jgi:ATP-binding cassette subfamily B protein
MDYDQIILMMEGEMLTSGTHKQLLKNSVEYEQIYNSQKQVA